jgi:hypothetical protein
MEAGMSEESARMVLQQIIDLCELTEAEMDAKWPGLEDMIPQGLTFEEGIAWLARRELEVTDA